MTGSTNFALYDFAVISAGGSGRLYSGEGCVLLAEKAKEQGINVVMETCGSFDPRYLPRLKKSVALFFWDVKDTNPERHKENTGVDNGLILENLLVLHIFVCLGRRFRDGEEFDIGKEQCLFLTIPMGNGYGRQNSYMRSIKRNALFLKTDIRVSIIKSAICTVVLALSFL